MQHIERPIYLGVNPQANKHKQYLLEWISQNDIIFGIPTWTDFEKTKLVSDDSIVYNKSITHENEVVSDLFWGRYRYFTKSLINITHEKCNKYKYDNLCIALSFTMMLLCIFL